MKPAAAVAALLLAVPPALPGRAAAPDAPAPPTKAAVVSLGDIRGGDSSSRLEIELELPEYPAAEVSAARVLPRKAFDDTGRDLLPDEEKKSPLEPVAEGRPGGEDGKGAPAAVRVKLRNPARRAKALAEVSGEVELYLPGRDPNAVASIPGIAGQVGRQLESPALSAGGVKITMLSREQLEAEKKRLSEKRKEEARKHGVLGEMLESMASAFLQAFLSPDPGDVVLKVEDPGDRIVRMRLLDASGADGTTGRMEQQGLVVLSSSRAGPGPDWSLEVCLRTPKSMERRSFTLKDVPLP